jgi:DNA gyrase subunit B
VGDIQVEVAARWHTYSWSKVESFANIERTTDGGTHVRGMLAGLIRGLRKTAPDACRGKKAKQLREAVSEGLDAVVCVRLNNPTYDGPMKSILATPAVEKAVRDCVSNVFAEFLQTEKGLLKHILSALDLYE